MKKEFSLMSNKSIQDPASPLEEEQKFGNDDIANPSQVQKSGDINLLENKSPKTIRAAKYDQLLNACLIDPLGLPRNILEDIPNWSKEFKLKFTCAITKEESTIKKYFSELAKFLKEEGFQATENLREYITLERINRNEKAGRSMYYVKRIWTKINPRKRKSNLIRPKPKNSDKSNSMKSDQQKLFRNREEELSNSNAEEIIFSEQASQKGFEFKGIPSRNINAISNNESQVIVNLSHSSFQIQNNKLSSEHLNERNSMQNNKFNVCSNELNSFDFSSQSPSEQISIQNSNFDGGPNLSYSKHSLQMFSEPNAMPNDSLNRVPNRSHSKTLEDLLNLGKSLWPQIEKFLHPERNTGQIVWKDCCLNPTTFCYYEKKYLDTSNAQTHEGRCGESKDKGKVFLCQDCYFRRFSSRREK